MGTGILTPTDYANGAAAKLKSVREMKPTVPASAVKPIAASGDIANAFAKELDNAEPSAPIAPLAAPAAIVQFAVSELEAAVSAAASAVREEEVQLARSEKRTEGHREALARKRTALGRALIAVRGQWGPSGPRAKGWGEFLDRHGVSSQRASEYMREAGFVDSNPPGIDGDAGENSTLVASGVDKRRRASDEDVRDAVGEDVARGGLDPEESEDSGPRDSRPDEEPPGPDRPTRVEVSPPGFDLRLGRFEDALADIGVVDALIGDPPYSPRTHASKPTRNDGIDGAGSAPTFAAWDEDDIEAFVAAWSPRTRGWIVMLCDDIQIPWWRAAYRRHGRIDFQPVPCVVNAMTVRQQGDGPSSWAVYAMVSRPTALSTWGTTPGAYTGNRVSGAGGGRGKPRWLMDAIVNDYTRPGDLVCDPVAGYGTTLISALALGRRAIGAEVDAEAISEANRRAVLARSEPTTAEITTLAPGATP